MKRDIALLFVVVALGASRVEALPLLQLDMRNGFYDRTTRTIEASGDPFTLYAVLSLGPNTSQTDLDAWLSDTYYVSVALTPQTSTPTDLGSFTFGLAGQAPTTVGVTGGMTYGAPPLESLPGLQGYDPGDLIGQRGIYPTYFREFAFRFSPLDQTAGYDPAGQAASAPRSLQATTRITPHLPATPACLLPSTICTSICTTRTLNNVAGPTRPAARTLISTCTRRPRMTRKPRV